jgi:hypothetical protein
MGFILGVVEIYTKVNTDRIWDTVMAKCTGLMALSIRENG